MSMSMHVDHKESVNHSLTIRPRVPKTWIPDAHVLTCFDCNVFFNFFKRKHHCRSCGRIFCDACSRERECMPFVECKNRVRTCISCAVSIRQISRMEWLIKSLAVMPVTFGELFLLRLLDKDWNYAVNTVLGIYRGLQYKLPCRRYLQIECDFLKSHYREFDGHIQWQLHSVLSMSQQKNIMSMPNEHVSKNTCRQLLCSRTCRKTLFVSDILRLTPLLHHVRLMKQVIKTWNRIQPVVHVNMMFWWVHMCLKYPPLYEHGLLKISLKNQSMTYALWFECDIAKNKTHFKTLIQMQNRLCSLMSPNLLMELKKSILFQAVLKQLILGISPHLFFARYSSVRLPWNPALSVKSIFNMKRLQSSTRPVRVSMQLTNGESLHCLLKNEDVRTDRLAMTIGYWINNLTQNLFVHTYTVFPLNAGGGCVVMMDNAKTLYDIRRQTTLTNYILSTNQNDSIKNVRSRFVKSCAGACLLAFTMGLGDRHLENIMVTPKAHLAHVDFGYILGEDPKNIQKSMRITDDMVNAMGGRNSATFRTFISITRKAYASMRLYSSFWYLLLSTENVIFQDKKRTISKIRNHIHDCFVPGEWNDEAGIRINQIVEDASHTSWREYAADIVHGTSNHLNAFLSHNGL